MSHLLLVESRSRGSGSPFALARAAVERGGHRVTLVTSDLSAYLTAPGAAQELRYLTRVLEVPDSGDAESLASWVGRIHADDPFDAVITLSDRHLRATAELAQRLGLTFARPQAVENTCNPLQLRQVLQRAGVPQPQWALVQNAADARRAADEIGYPVVVKPIDPLAALRPAIAHNAVELEAAAHRVLRYRNYGRAATTSEPGALVEEYARGTLHWCETLSAAGRHRTLAVAPQASTRGAIEEITRAALDAVRLDWGATYTSVALTGRGPVVVAIDHGRLLEDGYLELLDLYLGRGDGQQRMVA